MRSLPPLPSTRTRRRPRSTSASSSPRTSIARSPPSSISSAIARSRAVLRSATNSATSRASSASGSRFGARTNRPAPRPDRPGPRWPSRPRRCARTPVERRAAGTGFCAHTPATTAYSNNPRTAAIRRFIVAEAAPVRLESFTTTDVWGWPMRGRCGWNRCRRCVGSLRIGVSGICRGAGGRPPMGAMSDSSRGWNAIM